MMWKTTVTGVGYAGMKYELSPVEDSELERVKSNQDVFSVLQHNWKLRATELTDRLHLKSILRPVFR